MRAGLTGNRQSLVQEAPAEVAHLGLEDPLPGWGAHTAGRAVTPGWRLLSMWASEPGSRLLLTQNI